MKKNVASQGIGAEMITAADGSAFAGAVSVFVTIDNGTQTAGAGTSPAHEGNGYHSYTPTQAETNGDHIAFTFTGAGAIPVTVQVYTGFPQSQDHTTPIDNIDTVVDLIKVDTTAILDGTSVSGVIVATNNDKSGYSISGAKTTLDSLNDVAATQIVSAGAITTLSGAVANVDLVDTCTVNTDMRGTDGANTVIPDNAGITANGSAIAGLNNITASDVWTATTRSLTDKANFTISGTKTTLDSLNDISTTDILSSGDIDTYSLEESLKLMLAANVGVLSGAATTTITIQAADGTKPRLTATVDGDGNRSAVVKDATG